MATYVTKIRTESGDLQIDYNALANLPQSDPTLTKPGEFADAKATSDAIDKVAAELTEDINGVQDELNAVADRLTKLTPEDIGAVNVANIVNNLTTVEEGYVLDARQAYELNLLIQKRATTATYSAVFPANGWEGDASPFTQTVLVEGILATDNPIVDIDMSNAVSDEDSALALEEWIYIRRITANEGSVTMYCYDEIPTKDITIILKVVR